MAHRREAPERHDNHVADAGAHLIDKAAREQLAERIEKRKKCYYSPEALFGQADATLAHAVHQRGLQKPQNLPVHIVDRSGSKEHGANGPTHVPDLYDPRFAESAGALPAHSVLLTTDKPS